MPGVELDVWRSLLEAELFVEVFVVSVSVGRGVSFGKSAWLVNDNGGSPAWESFLEGVDWLDEAEPELSEALGCISAKPKQNNDIATRGGPINKRWEPFKRPKF